MVVEGRLRAGRPSCLVVLFSSPPPRFSRWVWTGFRKPSKDLLVGLMCCLFVRFCQRCGCEVGFDEMEGRSWDFECLLLVSRVSSADSEKY